MNKFQAIMGTGMGLVFMLIGGIFIPRGYTELKNAQESLNWPTTDGTIISSEIKENQDDDSTTYGANIRYKYTVGEKSYSSDQVSFGQYSSSDPEHARSIVRRYETRQKIAVHFNPANPNESVLEPGTYLGSYMILGISTVFFSIGAIIAVSFGIIVPKLRKRRTQAIKQAASTLALTFLEQDKTLQHKDFFLFSLFQHKSSREIRNILRKDSADGEVILFDYEFQKGSGDDSSQYHQTVAAFQVPTRNLPGFSLQPENLFYKIGELFGQQNISFESYPEFSKYYRLQGQLESAIRELFNFDVLQFFSQNHGWWLEGRGRWLVIYQINRQIKPEELSNFLQQTTQISQLFSSNMPSVVTKVYPL